MHALQVSLMRRDIIKMTDEQRAEFLEKHQQESKAQDPRSGQAQDEGPNPFPAWLIRIIFEVNPEFLYDRINKTYRAPYRNEPEAEAGRDLFSAAFTEVFSRGDVDKKQFFDSFQVRVAILDFHVDAAEADLDLFEVK
jgi:hypothetical protein